MSVAWVPVVWLPSFSAGGVERCGKDSGDQAIAYPVWLRCDTSSHGSVSRRRRLNNGVRLWFAHSLVVKTNTK